VRGGIHVKVSATYSPTIGSGSELIARVGVRGQDWG